MFIRQKFLCFVICLFSANFLFIAGCGTDNAASVSCEEEPLSQTPATESAAETVLLSSETETEASEKKEDTLNQEIMEQMEALRENGEYLAAIKATEGMDRKGDLAPKVIALRNEIIRGHMDYFETQLENSFENGDLYMIEVLTNFYELDEAKKAQYRFVKNLQGEYMQRDALDHGICVTITGYDVQVKEKKYKGIYFRKEYPEIPGFFSEYLILDNGAMELS